ncbi:MAG: acyl-CoA dehydrogenase [Chloroflexi bacterium]|nr:acyl-CoA dehydrogenase [Chloroflexota bacterium]
MDFELSEDQRMLKKMVRDFAKKEIIPIAAEIDKSGEFPWECVKKMGNLGMFGLVLPPAFGGTGPDKLSFFMALEEISAASASVALALLCSNGAARQILARGNEKQKRKYLPAMARGERLGACAVTEPSGAANWPYTLQSTARLKDGSYVINGSKCFTSNGGEAEVYVVLARTDPEKGPLGISGLIVEKDTPGFSFGRREEKLGLRGDVSRELFFDDCRVPKANFLSEGILPSVTREVAMLIMPALGAIAVGLAQASLEAATQYVKERPVAFGQMLANFDGVQSTIADIATKVEASRLLVLQAGAMSEDAADLTPGAMAGVFACEAALEVTSKALQLFGAYGYTSDFPIERYFRDARGLMIIAWPMEVRKLIIGRLKLGLPTLASPRAIEG